MDDVSVSAPSRLRAFLASKDWSQTDLAREIGHHQTHVGRLLLGKRGPGLEMAHAIELVTADWSEGPIRMEEWLGISSDVPVHVVSDGRRVPGSPPSDADPLVADDDAPSTAA